MYNKNEVIFSNEIGVCRVADIVYLSVNKKLPVQYYLLTSVFDKRKTSYIPVNGHQVILRQLISKEEAENKVALDVITELERKEINYVLEQNE